MASEQQRLPTRLTKKERDRLLALDMSVRDRAILTTFLFGGMRSNELSMLNVDDIDFEEDTIFIQHAKGHKQRILPLHYRARKALEDYLEGRTDGPIFLSNRGARISNRRLRSLVKGLAQHAGIEKDIHPHSLRHTFATLLREADVELGDVSRLLGHKKLQTTLIYDELTTKRKRSAVDRL